MTGYEMRRRTRELRAKAEAARDRATAHARVGEFREADDADADALDYFAEADEVEAEWREQLVYRGRGR